MSVAAQIRHARESKGWSQKQLAETIGVTPGFITKLEGGQAFPSYERCVALASVLELALDDLWSSVETERAEANQQRRQTRQTSVRGELQMRGVPDDSPSPATEAAPPTAAEAQVMVLELMANKELREAYSYLRRALVHPQPHMRKLVLDALRAAAEWE